MVVVADRMAEETAAATRVVHRTGAADFAITIQRFQCDPVELERAHFFVALQMHFSLYNSLRHSGLYPADIPIR